MASRGRGAGGREGGEDGPMRTDGRPAAERPTWREGEWRRERERHRGVRERREGEDGPMRTDGRPAAERPKWRPRTVRVVPPAAGPSMGAARWTMGGW